MRWPARLTSRPHGLPLGALRTLVGGTGVRQMASVAAAPILSRLYTPDDFGALALFMAIAFILLPVASLRYELAIPIATDRDVVRVVTVATGLAAALAVFTLPAAWAGRFLLPRFDAESLGPWWWLLPVTVFVGGLVQVLMHVAIRMRRYRVIARTNARQGVANLGVAVGLGWLSGPAGLLLGITASRTAGVGQLWREARKAGLTPGRCTGRQLRAVARRYVDFPRYSAWVGLSSSLGVYLMPIYLAGVLGAIAAGWYAFSTRIVAQPMTVLGNAVAQLYLGESSDRVKRSPDELTVLFRSTLRELTVVSVALFLPLGMFGGPVFAFVFGDAWREAGVYAQLLAPMFAAQFVTSPMAQTLTVMEHQRSQFAFASVRVVGLVVLFVGLSVVGPSPRTVVAAFSAFTTIAYLAYLWMAASAVSRGRNVGPSPSEG